MVNKNPKNKLVKPLTEEEYFQLDTKQRKGTHWELAKQMLAEIRENQKSDYFFVENKTILPTRRDTFVLALNKLAGRYQYPFVFRIQSMKNGKDFVLIRKAEEQ